MARRVRMPEKAAVQHGLGSSNTKALNESEMLIKNVKPKLIAGEHEVVEKKFTDSASIHERKDAEFNE
jgi:hypothetical protein